MGFSQQFTPDTSRQHLFSKVPQVQIPRSTFNRSFGVKTTFDPGLLIPVLLDEMLPGDTFHLKMHGLVRLATLLHPIMDNLYLDSFFFVVPCRLVWENWEVFMGQQQNPTDPIPSGLSIPQVTIPASLSTQTLFDYMGLPCGLPSSYSVNALPFRALNLIYNEWFRDQNLQSSLVVQTDNGPDAYANYNLFYRGKRHDYFTSALPFLQKGPAVTLPLGTSAPVVPNGSAKPYLSDGTTAFPFASVINSTAASYGVTPGATSSALSWSSTPGETGLQVDLASATAATINDIRYAFQLQRFYERDARAGSRYKELVLSHFGVVSADARLQRPEYCGGGTTPVYISPIHQTSPGSSGSTDLGDLAAYGYAAPTGHGFTYSSTEHCYVIGLISVRADLTYQQGLDKLWQRQVRTDFYWPVLSHIGEQAILNSEIYFQGNPTADNAVFGYQERYAEYRYKPSIVTGAFRSIASGSLDSWHLAQDFGSLPALGDTFIRENPPIDRVIAVPTEPSFIADLFFSYNCTRPMTVYSVPGLVDHF